MLSKINTFMRAFIGWLVGLIIMCIIKSKNQYSIFDWLLFIIVYSFIYIFTWIFIKIFKH
jgi:uncharacterized protein YacL